MAFEIAEDITVARTLPARVYSDPEIFRAQRERVFARTWHYAAHADVVKVAGQVHPFTLMPGALDEPLLLTRDLSDQVHCVSNLNINGLKGIYADLLGQPGQLNAGDYITMAPSAYTHVACSNP